MADEDRELAEEMALLHAETFDTTPSDNLSTCHQAAALAVYRRGRADLLSEFIPVHERHKVAGQVAFMRENWFNNGAEGETVHALCNLVDKLLALVPAEAGGKETT